MTLAEHDLRRIEQTCDLARGGRLEMDAAELRAILDELRTTEDAFEQAEVTVQNLRQDSSDEADRAERYRRECEDLREAAIAVLACDGGNGAYNASLLFERRAALLRLAGGTNAVCRQQHRDLAARLQPKEAHRG